MGGGWECREVRGPSGHVPRSSTTTPVRVVEESLLGFPSETRTFVRTPGPTETPGETGGSSNPVYFPSFLLSATEPVREPFPGLLRLIIS